MENNQRYRISWEMSDSFMLSAITGWYTVTRETDDPWDQYNQLKEWERTGEEPIRNVKLEKATIVWEVIPTKDALRRQHAKDANEALREAIHEDSEVLAESEEEYRNAQESP